jgi:hypothetical protein
VGAVAVVFIVAATAAIVITQLCMIQLYFFLILLVT